LEKLVIVPKVVEAPRKRKNRVLPSINIPHKITSCSLFNKSFKVECYKMKNIPSKTIPLTKDNIHLITSTFKIGLGTTKKVILMDHLDKINSLNDLPKLKIGIGQKTVEKLKRYFHIDNKVKLSTSIIDKPQSLRHLAMLWGALRSTSATVSLSMIIIYQMNQLIKVFGRNW
jgi:hypothetical protein